MAQDAKLQVRHYRVTGEDHSHDHHQIVLPLQGWMEMSVAGQESHVTDSQAVVIPAGQAHAFTVSAENAFLIMDVPAEHISHGANTGQSKPHNALWRAAASMPFVPLDARFGQLAHFAAGEVSQFGDAWGTHGLSDTLLAALERRMGLVPQVEPPRLRRARQFIETHHGEALDVAQIAQAAHLSPSRLHALFQTHYGTSPGKYLTRYRLERAAQTLRSSHLPVAQVALGVGFEDQSAFSRSFQRHHGVTPLAYRKAGDNKSLSTKKGSPGQDA
ncbi:MAG: AraC family transcriptional regulator [Pseudomonadota bacterium]